MYKRQGGAVDIDTNTGAGNILFSSTVATGDNNLSLDAGASGNITLSGALTGGGNLTVRDGKAQSYQALTVDSLNIQDATTSVTLGGVLTSAGAVNIDSGGTIGINAAASGTTFDIDALGVTTIAAAGDINASGAVTFGANKSGTLTTSGDIDTSNDNVTFNRAVTLGGAVDIDTGTGAGNILFNSTVATGDKNLSLDAGASGNITLSGALTGGGAFTVRDGAVQSYQALTVDSLNIQDATTSVTLGGVVTTETAVGITSGGTLTQNGTVTAGTNINLTATGQLTVSSLNASENIYLTSQASGIVQNAGGLISSQGLALQALGGGIGSSGQNLNSAVNIMACLLYTSPSPRD